MTDSEKLTEHHPWIRVFREITGGKDEHQNQRENGRGRKRDMRGGTA